MKRTDKSYPSVQFGTSLMLVVFIVLCLTAFAALSLSSALKNYSYSQKAAQKTTDYYKADSEAVRKLDEIAEVLKEAYITSPDSYPEYAFNNLSHIEGIELTEGETLLYPKLTYEVPVNDRQALSVSITLNENSPSEESLFYITKWKEISTEEWESNTTLPVLGSDE